MEDDSHRFNMKGRRSGNLPGPKQIKHTLKDRDRGVQFDIFAYRDLTKDEVAAVVKDWLGEKTMKDLTPWRTYRIQTELGKE